MRTGRRPASLTRLRVPDAPSHARQGMTGPASAAPNSIGILPATRSMLAPLRDTPGTTPEDVSSSPTKKAAGVSHLRPTGGRSPPRPLSKAILGEPPAVAAGLAAGILAPAPIAECDPHVIQIAARATEVRFLS